MKKILVFCDYYRPSVKSGGGMWTVANLVDRFCDRYEFHIVTRNYDSPGDTVPYTTVVTGEWNEVGNARVYYAAASDLTKQTCSRLSNEVGPDCVFLNSVFSTSGIKFLSARRAGMTPNVPIILAPCGELSVGALQSKSFKKKLFLAYAKAVGLYAGVQWKASTVTEVDEIRGVFGDSVKPMVAPDLTPLSILPDFSADQKPVKEPGSARFIFLSRIVPKKNLKYALERFAEVREGVVHLEIVGPAEEPGYWAECEKIIATLPQNVAVEIHGSVDYLAGLELLKNAHFFILPTLNENFGYVFIESLAAGTPILISDQTVWSEIVERNAGWVIPLAESGKWLRALNECVAMTGDEYIKMSNAARAFALEWLADKKVEDATARVLERALGTTNG